MWQDVSSRDFFERLLEQYCMGNEHYEGVNPDAVHLGAHRRTAQNLWIEFVQRVPSVPQEWAETLKRR